MELPALIESLHLSLGEDEDKSIERSEDSVVVQIGLEPNLAYAVDISKESSLTENSPVGTSDNVAKILDLEPLDEDVDSLSEASYTTAQSTRTETFEYHTLDHKQQQIRLLTILDIDDYHVHCELETTSLLDLNNRYTALSYCWGGSRSLCSDHRKWV